MFSKKGNPIVTKPNSILWRLSNVTFISLTLCLLTASRTYSQENDNSKFDSKHCGEVRDENGNLRIAYLNYNLYSSVFLRLYTMILQKDTQYCNIILNYDIHDGPQEPPYNTIRLTIDTCDERNSTYEYFQQHNDFRFDDTPYFKANLLKMDTMLFNYNEETYEIQKYRATLPDSQNITVYYSPLLGILKQYASYRSVSDDNFELTLDRTGCPQRLLVEAHLEALGLRDDFHERYDEGPRTIRSKILDKKVYKSTRKKYLEKGLMYKHVPIYRYW